MTKQRVTLIATPEQTVTDLVELLRNRGQFEVEVRYCSPSLADWYDCPFVRDPTGMTYFGPEGIRFLAEAAAQDRIAS